MKNVSVIVPIYKGNRYIPNLIQMLETNWESANMSETVEIEMILVNDSPTEELLIKEQWLKNISYVEIVNKQNYGIHFSRVQGFLQSKGNYILFLDQDDEISPVYLREQLEKLGDYDMIICNGKNCNNLIYQNVMELNRAVDENEYRNGYNWIVSTGQVLLRREAVPLEWLDNILKQNGTDDYFLWMLMFCKNRKIGIHDGVLYWHVISEGNTSDNWVGMYWSVLEVAKIMRRLGFLTSAEEVRIKANYTLIDKDTLTFEMYQKERKYKRILEAWMRIRDRKISVDGFLTKRHINKIAIYGAGNLGKHLYYELQENSIQVECFMDRNANTEIMGTKTVAPGVPIGSVDAIIVTPIMEYTQIKGYLEKFYSCNIISIESVISNADCELQTE